MSQRRDAILKAAFEMVGSYGFRRTGMEDIAKAAGVSRPALYNEFANKIEIYRAATQKMLEQSCAFAADALSDDGSLEKRLNDAIDTAILEPHRRVEAMSHGAELLEMKSEFASDIFADWEKDMQRLFHDALLGQSHVEAEVAQDVSTMMMDAIAGIKSRGEKAAVMEVALKRLVRIVVASIAPKSG